MARNAIFQPSELPLVDALAKADQIPERVDRAGLQRAPWRLFKSGPHVAIGLRADFAMEFLDAALITRSRAPGLPSP